MQYNDLYIQGWKKVWNCLTYGKNKVRKKKNQAILTTFIVLYQCFLKIVQQFHWCQPHWYPCKLSHCCWEKVYVQKLQMKA